MRPEYLGHHLIVSRRGRAQGLLANEPAGDAEAGSNALGEQQQIDLHLGSRDLIELL